MSGRQKPCHVYQRRRSDESKLDGDSVHPVRGLISMAAILLIIPPSLPLFSSVSLPASVSAVSLLLSKRRWVVAMMARHVPFLSFEFFHLTDPLWHINAHPYLPTCMHACSHSHTSCLISASLAGHTRSYCVTQWKSAKVMISRWWFIWTRLKSDSLTFHKTHIVFFLLRTRKDHTYIGTHSFSQNPGKQTTLFVLKGSFFVFRGFF